MHIHGWSKSGQWLGTLQQNCAVFISVLKWTQYKLWIDGPIVFKWSSTVTSSAQHTIKWLILPLCLLEVLFMPVSMHLYDGSHRPRSYALYWDSKCNSPFLSYLKLQPPYKDCCLAELLPHHNPHTIWFTTFYVSCLEALIDLAKYLAFMASWISSEDSIYEEVTSSSTLAEASSPTTVSMPC